MSEAQAGTPAAAPENSASAGQATPAADDSGLNAQQKQEWMTLKQKAEEFNKVKKERDDFEARLSQMERLAVSQGTQATDPVADDIAALRVQAEYDPAARAALRNMEMATRAQAEVWLIGQLSSVPEAKKDQVAALIRTYGYQIGAKEALTLVTDPETTATKQRLTELEAENARLKERAVVPNGSSPAATTAATASADGDATKESMPWSDVLSTLKAGGAKALALRQKMDSGKVKPDYAR